MRANAKFDELAGTASEVADEILETKYEEIDYLTITTSEWQEQVGPGQYFTCSKPGENERAAESTGILWMKERVYPAIMKNPIGHLLGGRLVERDEVENLGLERFTRK
jgi:hypothetical protein